MKNLIIILLVGILMASCSPCRRLARKCPPLVIREVIDSIITRDTIIYKDRYIDVPIPGKEVIVQEPVFIETIPPISAENDYAIAKTWVENFQLKLKLVQKEQIITYKLDSANQIAKHWEYRWKNEKRIETTTVREPFVPLLYKILTAWGIFALILFGVYTYLKKK